jgi:hypothetical protein
MGFLQSKVGRYPSGKAVSGRLHGSFQRNEAKKGKGSSRQNSLCLLRAKTRFQEVRHGDKPEHGSAGRRGRKPL